MKIQPKEGILLIKKHKKTGVKVDILVEEIDEDKRLITGEVINDNEQYKKGTTAIFGKYALYPLTLQGEEFYFLAVDDVIGTCDYSE